MQEIPDTGGGLSGFIAWLLWQVYVYFPFEGTWDWLLLFIFLAVLTRVGAIPASWKVVEWLDDQAPDLEFEAVIGCIYLLNIITQTGVMFLLIFVTFQRDEVDLG